MPNTFKIAVRKFEPFETTIQKLWTAFCDETGCTLKLEAVALGLNPLHNALLGKEHGMSKGDWDVVHINTDWIAEAYDNAILEDLAPWIDENPPEDYPQGWSDALLGMQTFGAQILGLPFHDGPECLIYRTDLFENEAEQNRFQKQYNKALKPPETWEEFHQIAQFFHSPEQNLYGSAFALFPDGHNSVFDFSIQLWAHGGALLDDNGKVFINTPQAVEALNFYRNIMNDETAVHPHSKTFDSIQAGMAFAKGEVAMMVNWFGFASMSEVISESKVKGKVNVSNIPSGPNGQGVSLCVYWLYAIAKGSCNKQIAYDFIRFATSKKNDKLLTLTGGIGCRKSTWNDAEVNRIVPFYKTLNGLHEQVGTLPRKTNWNAIAHVIDDMMTKLITSEVSIPELLEAAQFQINKIEL
ncbi:extracellular solute-binding protein [Formosa sp. A9]|uniref:extracellular solute-binding protein n=1 Tax=Formosa sp. A9 TaxID=3442641 RepID=UPI003EC07B09